MSLRRTMKTLAILILVAATVRCADITVIANDVSVEVGEDAHIPCTYVTDSANPAMIEWKRLIDGQAPQRLYRFKEGDEENTFLDPHPSNARTPAITVGADGGLIIKNTTIQDNTQFGNLRCEVSVGRLQASKDIRFIAAILPREDATITLSKYSEGLQGFDGVGGFSQDIGTCKSSASYPAADITFYKETDGKFLIVENDIFNIANFEQADDGLSGTYSRDLYKPLDPSDHQANFICNIRTVYGDKVFERNYTVPKFNVNHATRMANFVDLPVAYLGSTVTLKCVADGFPDANFRIKKNGEVQSSTAELTMTVTKSDDGSEYKCEAWNSDSQAPSPIESDVHTMEVLSVDDSLIEGVNISVGTTQVKYGEDFSAICKSEGKPTPSVSWYKGEKNLSNSGILTISEVKFSDAGDYTCKAMNGHANLNKETRLSVQVNGMVRVSEEVVSIEGKIGDTVNLTCIVHANPKPEFHWTSDGDGELEGDVMKDGNRYKSHLAVGPLSPELSEKEHICTATSYDGSEIVTTFKLPELVEEVNDEAGSVAAAVIIIVVVVLVIGIVVAVLYKKEIICNKSGAAAKDIAVGMNNDEEDVEAEIGEAAQPAEDSKDQPPADNPEEEKPMLE